jgi:uncharacterized protein (TIGR02611 family)
MARGADAPVRSSAARLRAFRARVRSLPGGRIAWRIAVTLIGVAVVVVGVILLPLPGPGWLIIFAGLGILASEYAWAARLLKWVKHQFVRWSKWVAAQPLWIQSATTVVSLAVIAALILGAWWLVRA